jgi:hypothetical protein
MRVLKSCLVAAFMLGFGAAPLHAQVDTVGCTYMRCALRVEYSFRGAALVRGTQGERVGGISIFGPGVPLLRNRSDSSGIYARRYLHNARWNAALGVIGGVALGTAIMMLNKEGPNDFDDRIWVLYGVGAAGLWGSLPFSLKAQRSLSRAVWWYNATLPQTP